MNVEKPSIIPSLLLSRIGYKLGLRGVSALVGLAWMLAFMVLWPGALIDKLKGRYKAGDMCYCFDPTGLIQAGRARIAIGHRGSKEGE